MIGIWPERDLIAEFEPSGGISNNLVVAFGNSVPCNEGRRSAETSRFVTLYVKPQGPPIYDSLDALKGDGASSSNSRDALYQLACVAWNTRGLCKGPLRA